MTPADTSGAENVAHAFVQQARELIRDEYLPKIERCLEKLNEEQIWWRANPESNSIGNLLLHICGNARQWIVCGLGEQTDERQRQSEFDERGPLPKDQLLSHLRQLVMEVDTTLSTFDSSRLIQQHHIQGTEVTALTAIFHVTEHFSMHTGQIILLTKLLANTDLTFYDFSSGKPVHTWQSDDKN